MSSSSAPLHPVRSGPAPSRPAPSRPAPSRPAPSRPAPSRPAPSRPAPSRSVTGDAHRERVGDALACATRGAVIRNALALAGLLSPCACVQTYDGNGMLATEDRALSGFDRVSARGSLEVELAPGDFAVQVRIDSNLLPRVQTRLDDETLIIQLDGGNLGDSLPGPHVLVTMPSLRDAELNGAGRLTAGEFADSEDVSIELSGAGEVAWSGDAEELEGVLNGSGSLTLKGSADDLQLALAGSGALDARGVDARRAEITVDGSGSVTATVDGRVDADVTGSGTIELFGDVIEGTWTVNDDEGSITGP